MHKIFSKSIKTYPLQELVDIKSLGNNYCLKVDCEGGESSLIDDEDAEKIILGAAHVATEIHCAYKGNIKGERFLTIGLPKVEQYLSWLKRFEKTHECKWTENILPIRGTIVMTRKDLRFK